MSTNYYGQALLQEMLYLNNLREIQRLNQEIETLRSAIYNKQKKHRRCDKDIAKNFNCAHCQKIYASDVALKLHLKLKHPLQKHNQQKSTSNNMEEQELSQQVA